MTRGVEICVKQPWVLSERQNLLRCISFVVLWVVSGDTTYNTVITVIHRPRRKVPIRGRLRLARCSGRILAFMLLLPQSLNPRRADSVLCQCAENAICRTRRRRCELATRRYRCRDQLTRLRTRKIAKSRYPCSHCISMKVTDHLEEVYTKRLSSDTAAINDASYLRLSRELFGPRGSRSLTAKLRPPASRFYLVATSFFLSHWNKQQCDSSSQIMIPT